MTIKELLGDAYKEGMTIKTVCSEIDSIAREVFK